jgi:predicted dehydrogenase
MTAIDRRTFLATSTAALVGTSVGQGFRPREPLRRTAAASAAVSPADAPEVVGRGFSPADATSRKRLALVGTGSRGCSMWGAALVEGYPDVVEIVGLFDSNGLRARAAQRIIGTKAPVFAEFDAMLRQTTPDAVVVATVDATHAQYVVRALDLGFDVYSEKPLCTDERQCRDILDAVARSGKTVVATMNARHAREAKKVKALLMEGAIGDVVSVDFHEYLDTSHGADYFRRWHRFREHSGTLLCHKASHHFDLANWWLASEPLEVSATGDLRFYGKAHAFRGTNCRPCPHKARCPFAWDVTKDPTNVTLYVECESEDGYLRDGCVFDERIDIFDTMSVRIRYASQAVVTYTASTYLPFEGQSVSFNGTRGRLDYFDMGGGGFERRELRLTRQFGRSEVVTDLPAERAGGHGGADGSLHDLLFRNDPADDPLELRADVRAGALASLVGIAARHSVDKGGVPVALADLVRV